MTGRFIEISRKRGIEGREPPEIVDSQVPMRERKDHLIAHGVIVFAKLQVPCPEVLTTLLSVSKFGATAVKTAASKLFQSCEAPRQVMMSPTCRP